MRVLLVSGSYPPMPCGVGDYTAQLARALGQRGDVTVAVLTGVAAEGVAEEGVELFPVVRTWGVAEASSIVGRIRRWRPDVVHIQYPTHYYREIQWVLPMLARIANGPVVQTWHEYYSSRSWPSILNAALPGGLVVVRPNYREKMPGWYRWLIRRKEFRFIPNASSIPAVRLTEDERAAVRFKVDAHGRELIAYFGFASPAKGIESLFEIADPQRHRLALICNLSAADTYQASILALVHRGAWAGKAVVTGFLPPVEAGKLLAAADAAVFPFRDGGGEWNSSIHGAAAQGTFILTTSLEQRGYDAGKNIHYAMPGDLEGMRQALREHLGERVPAATETPTAGWNSIADSHMELYRALLGRTGETRSSAQDGGKGEMSDIRLSVCIPTYNFGRFIGETLDSVIRQTPPDGVEILVVDGASTDDTEEVVRSRQERFPAIRYHRLEKKGGIDRDMAKSVELARGEYVWLFSADDWMAEGALKKVLDEMRLGLDLYLCGFTLCDFEMHPQKPHPILDAPDGSVYDLGDPRDRRSFFERGLTTTAFFSFMGSLVIRKEKWDSAKMDDTFVGSCWDHVARLFRLIPGGMKVKYLPEAYLLKRDDNDSFSERGVARRVGIAIEGYHRLANACFGTESAEARHIRRVLKNEYPLLNLLYIKSRTSESHVPGDMEYLDTLIATLYLDGEPADRVRHLLYRLAPPFALRPAEKAYKFARKFLPLP